MRLQQYLSKKAIVFTLLIIISPTNTVHALTYDEIKDTSRLVATSTGIVGGSYLVGKLSDNHIYTLMSLGGSYLTGKLLSRSLYKKTVRTYQQDLNLLKQYKYDEEFLRKKLKETVLSNHQQKDAHSSHYRNYPLLCYHQNLYWHIKWLRILRLFDLGSHQNIPVKTLLYKLKLIDQHIVTDYDFVKERRHWEEKKQ